MRKEGRNIIRITRIHFLAVFLAIYIPVEIYQPDKECYLMHKVAVIVGNIDLIKQHIANENLTSGRINEIAKKKSIDLDIDKILSGRIQPSFDQLQNIAQCLDIELSDLLIPSSNISNVVVKKKTEDNSYYFPDQEKQNYQLWPLARSPRMPLMKGSNIEVLTDQIDLEHPMVTSLHSYIYNYGDQPVTLAWLDEENRHEETIKPGDSLYLLPFVKYVFANNQEEHGKLFTIRVGGAVNLSTQKELSYFADVNRVIETKCWFD